MTAASDDPRRFLRSGRLEVLPHRWEDRKAVTRYLATVALPVLLETMSERELTERLTALSTDAVGLRRAMVDLGAVHRTRDGSEYWRTELTEFDEAATDELVEPEPEPAEPEPETRARLALEASGVAFTITRHGPVSSLEEAAAAQGLVPDQVLKTIVVRRGDGDFLLVLVPGARQIAWPRLRSLLGVSRLSLPDKAVAREATGYERGTITPFGAVHSWPVIADSRIAGAGIVSIGAGGHGVAARLDADALLAAVGAQVVDVTDPAG